MHDSWEKIYGGAGGEQRERERDNYIFSFTGFLKLFMAFNCFGSNNKVVGVKWLEVEAGTKLQQKDIKKNVKKKIAVPLIDAYVIYE